ncbi:MAG TPA: DUF6132 family protein [Prolixibacteraceae bacterium]|nr:DUF6132 family protein [Prolixibacteraceae bacterium]
MKGFVTKHKWALMAGIAGGIGGFLYWRFVGCTSGTCPIKSVWYWSTLWGAVMGYLIGDMVNDWFVRRKLWQTSKSADNEGNPSL